MGARGVETTPGLAVSLTALGLTLGPPRRCLWVCLGIGLLLTTETRSSDWEPDLERPVSVSVRVIDAWTMGEFGPTGTVRVDWLRQGLEVRRWRQRLRVFLPASASIPSAARLRLTGYLRHTEPLANGFAPGRRRWQLRVKSSSFIDIDSRSRSRLFSDGLAAVAGGLRARLQRQLKRSSGRWPWRNRLVEALVLGRFDALPDSIRRSLRASGLAHLFALSGLHVGLLAACASQLTMGAGTGPRAGLIIALMVVYGLLAGDRPSLVRSTIMLGALLASVQLKRPPAPLNTLAWVAAAMLVTGPDRVWDVGFQLSFAATAGILVLAPRLYSSWVLLPPALRLPLSVSVGAHLAGLPWALAVFHVECPLSPLTFLMVLPWTVATLVLCMAWTVGALVWPPILPILDPVVEAMGRILEATLEVPWSRVLAIPSALDRPTAVLVTIGATIALLSGRWPVLALAGAVALASVVGGSVPAEIVMLDVGQGDAFVVREGSDTVLVDGGGWRGGDIAQSVLVPALAHLGIRRLTGVVLTHPDVDHCRGLLGLSSYLPIEQLYLSPGWSESDCAAGLLTGAGTGVRPLWRGESFTVGRWRIRAIHPAPGRRQGRNNRSLVLLAEVGTHRVLLTGDLERRGELEIVEALGPGELPTVDVLKVGHHGSATSTSSAWLDRLRPRLALISCGRGNRYGHPAAEILEQFDRRHIRMVRTDRDGGIRIVFSDSGNLRIHPLGSG